MIQSGRYDIFADRWVPCIRTFTFLEFDFTGATIIGQVRLKPDLSGTPLIDLATVGSIGTQGFTILYAGIDTVANHITAGRISEAPEGYETTDSLTLSQIGMRINESTMEGLPFPGEIGDDAELAWDMHITPSGGVKDKYLGGAFIVKAGVTQ